MLALASESLILWSTASWIKFEGISFINYIIWTNLYIFILEWGFQQIDERIFYDICDQLRKIEQYHFKFNTYDHK